MEFERIISKVQIKSMVNYQILNKQNMILANLSDQHAKGQMNNSISTQKCFYFDKAFCTYTNTYIIKIEQHSNQMLKLQINNKICKKEGNSLFKSTQVRYGNRRLIINDKYDIISNKQLNQTEYNIKRFNSPYSNKSHEILKGEQKKPRALIFMTDRSNKQAKNNEKGNTKNIVKNFIKAFMKYLDNYGQQEYNETKHLIDNNNFNNQLIRTIVDNNKVGPVFFKFLRKQANQWIQKSRIKDKKTHKNAINVYIQLFNLKYDRLNSNCAKEQKFEYKPSYNNFEPIFNSICP